MTAWLSLVMVLLVASQVQANRFTMFALRAEQIIAERATALERVRTCLDVMKIEATPRSLGPDEGLECIKRAAEWLNNQRVWPICRTLIGRFSSFEICIVEHEAEIIEAPAR